MRNLILVSEYFFPSEAATAQLATDLSLHLSSSYSINVLTTSRGPNLTPLTIHRITGFGRTSNLIKKILSALWFYVSALTWLLRYAKPEDELLIFSNPPFIVSLGFLVHCFKGNRFIFVFQDLFPYSACLAGILPSKGLLKAFWIQQFKICFSMCSTIIVLSESMRQKFLAEYGSHLPCKVIHNWSPSEPASSESPVLLKSQSRKTIEWDLQEYFTVQYSGNFGRLHDLITLLEAARLLKDYKIRFVFIGDGAKKNQILKYKSAFELDNVILYPYQDRSDLTHSLASADLSVVTLTPGADDIVAPSKVYGILSSARPILLIGGLDSELARVITDANIGVVSAPGDVERLAQNIKYLSENPTLIQHMSDGSFKLYHSQYTRRDSCEKYSKLLQDLA